MARLYLALLLTFALLGLSSCGCIPEPDPNLREIPAQKNCGNPCSNIGVSPTVPYKIEGGHGWR